MAVSQSSVHGCVDFYWSKKAVVIKERLINKFVLVVANLNDLDLFTVLYLVVF